MKMSEPKHPRRIPAVDDNDLNRDLTSAVPAGLHGIDRTASMPTGPAPVAPPVWNTQDYDALVDRLGPSSMREFLGALREECRTLRALLDSSRTVEAAQRHRAHDLASTSGMVGFLALSKACRRLMTSPEGGPIPADIAGVLDRALHAMAAFLDRTASAA